MRLIRRTRSAKQLIGQVNCFQAPSENESSGFALSHRGGVGGGGFRKTGKPGSAEKTEGSGQRMSGNGCWRVDREAMDICEVGW